jgi:hypothetical protein
VARLMDQLDIAHVSLEEQGTLERDVETAQ